MSSLERNEAYGAVQNTAHGLFSWQTHEYVLACLGAVIANVSVNILVGMAVFVAVLLCSLVGRRAWQGRRDYLFLWARRFERERHYRLLEPDTAYRPYGESL